MGYADFYFYNSCRPEHICILAYYSVVCYDLDPWAQGQAKDVSFTEMCFTTILSEVQI